MFKIKRNTAIIIWIILWVFYYICVIYFNLIKDTKNEIVPSITYETDLSQNIENNSAKIYWDNELFFNNCSYFEDLNFELDPNLNNITNLMTDLVEKWKIFEVCKTKDNKKYLFSFNTRFGTNIWRYDADLNIVELTKTNNCLFLWCWVNTRSWLWERNYWDISLENILIEYKNKKENKDWFWIKKWNKIVFKDYWEFISWDAEAIPWLFSFIWKYFKNSTVKYCDLWKNSDGTLSVCFVDIEYEYDYIENTIQENRICSYYVWEDKQIKTLEKCFNFPKKDWYDLVWKKYWFDFYQKKWQETSIFVVDLAYNNFDFWVLKANSWSIFEWENPEFSRFKRLWIDDIETYKNYFLVNWGFFNASKDPTALSFPLKIDWKIINSHIDNDLPKRTLILENNVLKILDWFDKKYLDDENITSLAVAFHPLNTDLMKDVKLWRTFFWIDNYWNLVFVVSNSSTQQNMIDVMKDFYVKEENIIMFDWWPSSWFWFFDPTWPWAEFEVKYFDWKVPHLFWISEIDR